MADTSLSRHANRSAAVTFGTDGIPAAISFGRTQLTVTGVLDTWREWYDVLDGGPERDIWILETGNGICEVHGLRAAITDQAQGDSERPYDQWLLCRWED